MVRSLPRGLFPGAAACQRSWSSEHSVGSERSTERVHTWCLVPTVKQGGDLKFHIYKDSSGNYRWRLKARNGQTVASSGESFSSKSAARTAAENVKANAGSATIVDD